MKLPFTIHDSRFTTWKKSAASAAVNRQSSIVNHQSQTGVALVITLILLSVTLVMALAFLAISSRDRGSVSTQTDMTTTRLAADAGLAAAEAQIAANVLSTTNPYSFGLLVSTNYLPPTNGNPLLDLANLQYSPRAPVLLTNLVFHTNENRFYLDLNRNGMDDPNGWVTNYDNNGNAIGTSFQVGDPEWIGVLERPDLPYGPNNKFIARFAFIALPVGNSLDLNAIYNQAHRGLPSPPTDSTVNPPANENPLTPDSFIRNESVGTWELNLAAFLADLNTNQWDPPTTWNPLMEPYKYPAVLPGGSVAFDDARALLAYRYNNNFNTLALVPNLFGANGATAFENDNIDGFTYGSPLMTSFELPGENDLALIVNGAPWVGADNTNRFFTPEELFDPTKTAVGVATGFTNFTQRLQMAGGGTSTYDRYTFYRMLAQLGTDTTPESGKMNLNYDNLDPYVYTVAGLNYTNTPAATNFMAWQPLAFFTNAADRLLKASTARWAVIYYTNNYGMLLVTNNPSFVATFNVTNAFGVTGIPVLVSNRFVYTPAVNRLLQLAANIYDATTTNHYPDIFRPVFNVIQTNGFTDVYISGYTNQTSLILQSSQMVPGANFGILDPPIEPAALPLGTNVLANVYGVPWIIGAKKGFPNFNAFSMETAFQLVRKLEVMRDTNATPQPHITWTNQMYLMNITNYFGLSCWNSYRSNYPGPVDILVRCGSSITLTNDNNMFPYVFGTNFAFATETKPPNWPAWNGTPGQASASFLVPLNTSVLMLTNAMYYYNEPNPPNGGELINYLGDSPSNYLDKGIQELPHFGLLMTNRLQVAIIDYSTNVSSLNAGGPVVGQIVDYVQLGGMDSSQLLNSILPENDINSLWDTNYDVNGNLFGVYNQIQVSKLGTTIAGQAPTGSGAWTAAQIPGGPGNDTSPAAQQAFFRGFFTKDGSYSSGGTVYTNTQSAMQTPYTPMVFGIQHTTWGANDPLVHYLASDLAPHIEYPNIIDWGSVSFYTPPTRYQPWGVSTESGGGIDTNPNNLSYKDPLVRGSDNWDFPTNTLPTVGWLGRVHRGTPWQTVYLKSANILNLANNVGLNTWASWTGDGNTFDLTNSAPVEDRLMFDLFTTAFNDNATRGQLSINISSNSLAAWSAVFSGVTVLSNNLPNSSASLPPRYQKPLPLPLENPVIYTNLVIAPAGVNVNNSPLARIVAGIDQARATFTNRDSLTGVFEHKGDILATPQLAEQSPFLNWNNAAQQTNGISDEMYEWLPQQVMSLVRVGTPRYVIYSYGQTLKPAPGGTYLGAGPYFGMVTNYQVVSEIAARAVVRFDTVRTNGYSGANSTVIVTPPRAVIEQFNILPPD
jgi:hypothetical protein